MKPANQTITSVLIKVVLTLAIVAGLGGTSVGCDQAMTDAFADGFAIGVSNPQLFSTNASGYSLYEDNWGYEGW
jgi:hypothetical protein